jgi:SAM-dependent MidA family methyltransferase
VRDRIAARIASEGPLPFDEFMRVALYDPAGGYFASGALRSEKGGDFLTSPEVSPMFGETLARFVTAEAERIGTDRPDVAEAGSGSGSLLRPLLDALPAAGRVWAVEVSPAAREAVAALVPEATLVESLEAVPGGLRGVVVANELADNLPAAVAVRRGGGWAEQRVDVSAGGGLVLVEAGPRPEVAAWADAHGGEVPEGGLVEVQMEAGRWLSRALGRLEAGAVVMIDYGDTPEGLRSRRAAGTLRTYRSHHLGPDPLSEPGATDITMDVDFAALESAAREAGAAVEIHRQEDFLGGLGLRDRLRELRHTELELARSGEAMARLKIRSDLTDGETLLHPRGLGDFRVLVARKG